MDKKLFDAAIANDVGTLSQLLEQDPLILFKSTANCEDKNPLHIAAMLGHENFARAMIGFNYTSCYYMCLARDRDGRNPLHVAAAYGKLPVLTLLIDAGFRNAALEKADGGGTILHLCLKYNQLAALKFLVEKFTNSEFLNAKNEDGMTILHLAIYYEHHRDLEFLKFLINVTGPEVIDITDANGNTAIDLLKSGKNTEDREILRYLRVPSYYGVPRGYFRVPRAEMSQWLEKSKDSVMVVASLIATMAFQAGVSPPGGVWQEELLEGPNPHRAGQAVMAQSHPKYYRLLDGANALVFTSSLATIILLMSKPSFLTDRLSLVPILVLVMRVAVTALATSYALSIVMVVPKDARSLARLSNKGLIVFTVFAVWMGWMYIKFIEKYASWLFRLARKRDVLNSSRC